jgi:ABC-type nitrate/sulfonate/bicarbonate transport system permease component
MLDLTLEWKLDWKKALWTLLPTFFVIVAWEVSAKTGLINTLLFPAPSAIVSRLGELITTPSFLLHFQSSLFRILAGLAIAIPFAVIAGISSELFSSAGAMIRPWVAFLYPIPKIAVFPLLIAIFGIGEAPKIAVIALGAFFLIFLSVAEGTRRLLQSPYMDAVHVFRISKFDFYYRILLKGLKRDFLAGLKAGAGYGWIMVVSGEFVMSDRGLGVAIWTAWDQFRIIDVYCGLLVLALCGYLTFHSIDLFTARIGACRTS